MRLNKTAVALLKKRGYETKEQIIGYLSFKAASLRKVRDMVSGKELLSGLAQAVKDQKNITVYGDYDADGVMASYILYAGFEKLLPGRVNYHINDRFEDGYNITPDGIDKMLAKFPKTEVIITCDNGIGAFEAVSYAQGKGLQVFVTDHHEQSAPARFSCPVVDEKSLEQLQADARDGIVNEEFCGAELARRIITELYQELGTAEKEAAFLDGLYAYSGFATITDVVPLRAANRYVARRGLMVIDRGEDLWGVLHDALEIKGAVDADTIGFRYGPMINAAGRVTGKADDAMRVMLEKTPEAVNVLAKHNEARKSMCQADDACALRLIREQNLSSDKFILVAGEEFREGINGLTASHLVERYKVPAAVMCPVKNEPGRYKGSARSVEGFDLFKSLTSHGDLIKAGGHPMAAGFSAYEKDLDAIRALLIEDAANADIPPGREPDFDLKVEELSLKTVRELEDAMEVLKPFGSGFEPVKVRLCGSIRSIFAKRNKDGEEKHASFSLKGRTADGLFCEVIWWNRLDRAKELFPEGTGEAAFTGMLGINEYNGYTRIQLKADDVEVL